MACWSGGDPHINDFFGRRFDMHNEGTFTAAVPTMTPTQMPTDTDPPTAVPTTATPTASPTRPLPKHMACWSGGDPHVNDFFGRRFDMHNEGTFTAYQQGHFKVQ